MKFKSFSQASVLRAGSALSVCAVMGAGALFAAPAYAQTTECPAGQTVNADGACETTPADAKERSNEIVVTGSRIRRDEFSSAEPVTIITKDEITQAGFNSVTDSLQSTAVTQGSAQINNYYGGFVTDGGTGANTLGLRGLGPGRTLILLNGRRLAPGGTRGSVLAADLNVLPTSIVERTEVLRSGASSVYGSDAVAGVVNIITDTEIRGVNIELQANVPEIGAGVSRRAALTFGFGDDRLNVVGSVEYLKRDAVTLGDVPWAACPIGGFLTGEGTAFGSGDGVNSNGDGCFTLDNGGTTINTLGLPTRDAIGRTSGMVGRFNRFLPDPSVTTGPFPGYLGVGFYDRDAFDPDMLKEPVITEGEILTGYLSATYDIGSLGNAQAYFEALVTRRKSSSPLYRQLSLDYVQGSPLLPANIRDGRFLGPNVTSGGRNVAARVFMGFGLTESRQSVDYARISGGIRGDFVFDGWRYDAFVGKAWNDGQYEIESFLTDRIAASLDVVDMGGGVFRCASSAVNVGCVAAPALSADVIGGNLPQNYRDYILQNTIGNTQFRETTFAFNIDGPLFAAPGGDVQLALGVEYRSQSINDQPDQNSLRGNLLGLTAATPTVGSDNVKEGFGEIFIPLLADVPGFYRFNLNGSARYTDYASYGSDVTYKVAAEWEPVRGVAFRGSYGTSYRAPALAEQFLGATSGFLSSTADPCDDLPPAADQSPNQQIIARNCASIGLPADFIQTSGITVFRVGGAEAGLGAETSTNWTVGGVLNPVISDGFGDLSLALDYFEVKVSNGVADLSGGTILNRCYAAENFDPNEGFCRFVERNANNQLTVTSSFVNLAEDNVKGYEFNGRYARDLFGGRFIFNAAVTHYTEQSARLFPEEFLTNATGTVTTPDWTGAFDVTFRTDDFSFRYGLDWTDASRNRTYDFFAFDNLTGEVDQDSVEFFRDNYLLEVDDYFLHNASVQFNIADKYELTLGVQNIFNTEPPQITAVGFSTVGNAPLYSGYDYRGRTFFVNTGFAF